MELDRRNFLRGMGAASGAAAALLGCAGATPAIGAGTSTQSRKAYGELLDVLAEVDRAYLSEAYRITQPGDIADGHRYVLHVLEGALDLYFESNPDYPIFKRIVTPSRKANGDNPDAIYFTTAIRGDRRYRITGNIAGATYTSFTVEAGTGVDGTRTDGVLNDTQMTIGRDGRYEIDLSPGASGENGLALPKDAVRLVTRHYFERERSVAADSGVTIPLRIEPLDSVGPPPDWNDERIAAGIRKVAARVRAMTLDRRIDDPSQSPGWVSQVPNHFNPPAKPGTLAASAFDAAYTMAPYLLKPGEALLIQGRFPTCRFANVALWNRYLQTYDYAYRQVGLNRAQTHFEPDGSFRVVVAHEDPGVPNWLDTMGRPFGMVYWRFLLPEGDIETPRGSVVPLKSLS